jgi:hypothetical protein
MDELGEATEQQLRDRVKSLRFDEDGAVSEAARLRATKSRVLAEDELARRFARAHPLRVAINRLFAKLLGADRRDVERQLRSVDGDELGIKPETEDL